MSVKRYTVAPSTLIEVKEGYIILHSDYATLLARHDALKEAILQIKEYANGQNWKSIVNMIDKIIAKEDK